MPVIAQLRPRLRGKKRPSSQRLNGSSLIQWKPRVMSSISCGTKRSNALPIHSNPKISVERMGMQKIVQ